MSEKEYLWSKGSRFAGFGVGVEFVHDALEEIRAKGKLGAAEVVVAAKKGDSNLHPLFEWNDEKAGNEHRVNTARLLIRSIHVKDRGKPPLRVYAAARLEGEPGRSYRPISELLKNKTYRKYLLQQAQMEYMRARKKYAQLQELAGLHMKIDEEISRLREESREHTSVRLTGARI